MLFLVSKGGSFPEVFFGFRDKVTFHASGQMSLVRSKSFDVLWTCHNLKEQNSLYSNCFWKLFKNVLRYSTPLGIVFATE